MKHWLLDAEGIWQIANANYVSWCVLARSPLGFIQFISIHPWCGHPKPSQDIPSQGSSQSARPVSHPSGVAFLLVACITETFTQSFIATTRTTHRRTLSMLPELLQGFAMCALTDHDRSWQYWHTMTLCSTPARSPHIHPSNNWGRYIKKVHIK